MIAGGLARVGPRGVRTLRPTKRAEGLRTIATRKRCHPNRSFASWVRPTDGWATARTSPRWPDAANRRDHLLPPTQPVRRAQGQRCQAFETRTQELHRGTALAEAELKKAALTEIVRGTSRAEHLPTQARGHLNRRHVDRGCTDRVWAVDLQSPPRTFRIRLPASDGFGTTCIHQ